jgi:hypothetical protein
VTMENDDTSKIFELDVPEALKVADRAQEVCRAFVADGALHVALESGAFGSSTSEWGRLLGEIARHIAKSSALNGLADESRALAEIERGFAQAVSEAAPGISGTVVARTRH